jgi:hypothetical protein
VAEWPGRIRAAFVANWPRLLAITQRVFLVVALFAIAWYLVRHAADLRGLLSWRVAAHCLIAALLLAAVHPLIAWAFFQLQRYNGIAIGLSTSLAIYMRRIPARYVPGGVWHSVSRLADMRLEASVGIAQLRSQFLLEAALVATSGLLVCGLGFLILPGGSPARVAAALQAGIGAAVALVTFMLVRRRAGKRRLLFALSTFLVVWPVAGGAFAIIAAGLAAPDCGYLATVSTYVVAAVQGYVAIFAPQGWGVTEASFTLFDPCGRALHQVLGAFLLYRFSAIGGDLLGYAVWAFFARRAAVRPPSTEAD